MVIFDFDLTLADTSPVEHLRTARKWRQVMAAIPRIRVYGGIHELLADLRADGYPLAILTKSPSMIPRAFVQRYRWPI